MTTSISYLVKVAEARETHQELSSTNSANSKNSQLINLHNRVQEVPEPSSIPRRFKVEKLSQEMSKLSIEPESIEYHRYRGQGLCSSQES
jgi:hypothetical protein